MDAQRQFAIVHNGIIENYSELKEELRNEGIIFTSETDSEIIVHFIAKYFQGNLLEAVQKTLTRLQGAYAFCVVNKHAREIIGVRNGSPLIMGQGEHENFYASDVSALLEYTKKVVYLDDFQLSRITEEKIEIYTFQGKAQPVRITEVEWDLEKAQKQGFKHFMLKEIFEQPEVMKKTLKISVNVSQRPQRIIIVACGTASYAGFLGKYIIEKIAKIQVINEIASEFRYKEQLFLENDLVIPISQSGETADTLAAVRLARENKIRTLGIINVIDSTMAREVDKVTYTQAGPEIGVASTKAFIAQIAMMYLLAYTLAGKKWVSDGIVEKMEKVLSLNGCIREIAAKYYLQQNFLYIGRGANYPLALEGALKLKEISYIHAEAYPAGELKHGPLALVSEEMPTMAICPQDDSYVKTMSNIEEIKARNGKIIAIATEGDEKMSKVSDDVIFVPNVENLLYPFVITIALQLFAYHVADLKSCDIDKPRNLAKSVTVE